jgi:pentatricopeptide repeat protein
VGPAGASMLMKLCADRGDLDTALELFYKMTATKTSINRWVGADRHEHLLRKVVQGCALEAGRQAAECVAVCLALPQALPGLRAWLCAGGGKISS